MGRVCTRMFDCVLLRVCVCVRVCATRCMRACVCVYVQVVYYVLEPVGPAVVGVPSGCVARQVWTHTYTGKTNAKKETV